MAILFCDSFNSYGSTSDLSKGWGDNTSSTNNTLSLTGGPDSSPCYLGLAQSLLGGALASAPAATALGVRFRFKQAGINTGGIIMDVDCRNAAGTTLNWRVSHNTSTGVLNLSFVGAASVLVSGTVNICDGNFHLIEIQIDAKDAAGVAKAWIDGVLDLNFSGDTFSGTAHATPWLTTFGIYGNTLSRYIDDIILFDSAGVAGNLRTGDQPFGNIVIATLRPSGAGTTTQFTPSAGSNFQCVDEVSQNDGTDYVEATTSGFRDLYAMGNLGLSPTTVYGVVAKIFAQNPGGLTISMKQTLKSGATTTANTASVANLSGDYKVQVYDLDPDGSVVWTGTTVDAVEQGFEVA